MTTAPLSRTAPKRRPSRGRKWIITLFVLVALFVGADFALAAAGEYQVAQKMRTELRLTEDPSVRINGFPFITQALNGDYRDIEISATGVPVQDQLRDLEIQANLLHTRIGLSNLLAGDTKGAKIDRVQGRVKIKATDLNRLVNQVTPFTDMAIEPDTRTKVPEQPANAPRTTAAVKLTGNTTLASRKISLTAYGTVTLVGGQVELSITELKIDDVSLEPFIQQLKQALSVKIDPGVLPFTVTPTAVHVESGAFTVEGTVDDIPLDQGNG
jgi:LmeA-like phospholipid-binding